MMDARHVFSPPMPSGRRADLLSRPHSRVLRRKCACGGNTGFDGECEECRKKKLQRSTSGAAPKLAPASVHQTLQSPGQPLDPGVLASMEMRLGHDFNQVRVHADSQAARSARAVNALAYTVGDHIAFDTGQYRPDTLSGRRLVAHELVHVVQQSAHGQTASDEIRIAGNDAAEHEAEQMGVAVEADARETSGKSCPGPVLQAHYAPRLCERYGNCPPPPFRSPICPALFHQDVMLTLAREYVRTQLDPSLSLKPLKIDCFAGLGPCTIEFDSGVAVRIWLLLKNPWGPVRAGEIIVEEIIPPPMPLKDSKHKHLGRKCFYDVGCKNGGQLTWVLTGCRPVGPLGPGDFPTQPKNTQVA